MTLRYAALPKFPFSKAAYYGDTFANSGRVWQENCPHPVLRESTMLYYTWIFLVIALLAALFGFGLIASAAAGIAKILFFIFLALFLISLITGRRAV